ncbi:DUF2142 domain-containing protein [Agromyces agglutinans]|uniref:DUF2142 domain-containing protein n=1 Tax=Agromyces agglutinans TaxID=2662258 RepID=UPI0015628E8D|nr:DUF2142 domain-containing protein [Agromyces agglutinans]
MRTSFQSSKAVRVGALVVAPLALLVALLGWSLSTPLASSPDEDFHLASIWCGSGERDGLCEPASDPRLRMVPVELLNAQRCFDHLPDQAATCPRQPPSLLVETDRGNFDAVYPPVFYAVMSMFATSDFSVSLLLMRAFNAVLYVGMMSALFVLLPRARRGTLLWGSLATIAPFGMFLIPSVNPSSWGVISASTMWLAVLGYYEARGTRRRVAFAALAVLSLILGAGSRSDAAAFVAIAIVIATVLSANPTISYLRRATFPAALFLVAVAVFLSFGQSNAVNPGVGLSVPLDPTSATLTPLQLFWINLTRLPELWAGAFGAPIGTQSLWLGTVTPGVVWFPAILAFGGVVFLGLRALDWRKAICLGILGSLLVSLPMIWLMRDQIMVGQGVQSRYLYPILIMLAMMSLFGLAGANARMNVVQLVCIAGVAWAANLVVQWMTLRRYVTGLDARWINLDNGIEWWWAALPIGPMALWVATSVAFAVLLSVCVCYGAVARHARQFGPSRLLISP